MQLEWELVSGPMPKSFYTCQLEIIVKKLLQGVPLKLVKKGTEHFMLIDNMFINWSETIRFANIEHIALDDNDFLNYENYFSSRECINLSLATYFGSKRMLDNLSITKSTFEKQFRDKLYQAYDRQSLPRPQPEIRFEEMQSINKYTGLGYFLEMNALLRGQVDVNTVTDAARFKAAIIHCAFCASGLRRLPLTPVLKSHRGEDVRSREEHQKLIEAAQNKSVVKLSGFVSSTADLTSHHDKHPFDTGVSERSDYAYNKRPVQFQFENLRGVFVAPIANLPNEREFLIPPSQVQLLNYTSKTSTLGGKKSETHHFSARMVEDLASLTVKDLEMRNLYLTQTLHHLPSTLRTLNLSRNSLEFMSTDSVVDALLHIPSHITQLNLSGNQLTARLDTDLFKIIAAIPSTVKDIFLETTELSTSINLIRSIMATGFDDDDEMTKYVESLLNQLTLIQNKPEDLTVFNKKLEETYNLLSKNPVLNKAKNMVKACKNTWWDFLYQKSDLEKATHIVKAVNQISVIERVRLNESSAHTQNVYSAMGLPYRSEPCEQSPDTIPVETLQHVLKMYKTKSTLRFCLGYLDYFGCFGWGRSQTIRALDKLLNTQKQAEAKYISKRDIEAAIEGRAEKEPQSKVLSGDTQRRLALFRGEQMDGQRSCTDEIILKIKKALSKPTC